MIFAVIVSLAMGQTPYPQITHALPSAVTRGQSAEIEVFAAPGNLSTARQVVFQGEGLRAEVVPPADKSKAKPNSARIRVTADGNTAVGPREFRVITMEGVSTVGQLLVVDQPVRMEAAGAHASAEKAQPLEVGTVVCGQIAAREEVDAYKVELKEGQEVTFAVTSFRFFFKRHSQVPPIDPVLTLLDPAGREVAGADDVALADPILRYACAKGGAHTLIVRDVDYSGVANAPYLLEVREGPWARVPWPPAAPIAATSTAGAIGWGLPEGQVPCAGLEPVAAPRTSLVQLQLKSGAGTRFSNPFPVWRTALGIVPEQAASIKPGVCVVGRLEKKGEIDSFKVELAKGLAIIARVHSRKLGTPLDSHLSIIAPAGKQAGFNDDASTSSKDSTLAFTAAVAGIHEIRLRDLLGRGGPDFVYALEVESQEPGFTVTCDDDKAGIVPGGAAPWFVRVSRSGGYAGAVTVRVDNLPSGISAEPCVIPAGQNDGLVLLRAKPGATPAASAVRMSATGEGARPASVAVQPLTDLTMPGGGRSTWPVDLQVAAITPEGDIEVVTVEPARVNLKPGQSQALNVTIKRAPRYTGRVSLDLKLQHLGQQFGNPLPAGVTVDEGASKLVLAEGVNTGKIVIKAAAEAPASTTPLAAHANVSISFTIKRAYSSAPFLLTVEK
ncbi:MAG: hypothetical protein ACKO9Z_08025 [Planctomycetota bacterium]